MATTSNVLFSWADVEKLPELRRLELVLDTLPDEELLATLEAERGRGRNDYPVRAMWRALLAGVVFGHRSIASLLRELGRNPALLTACGFDPLPRQARPRPVWERDAQRSRVVYLAAPCRDSIPSHWNFSRFVSRVVEHEAQVRAMFERLGEELREALDDTEITVHARVTPTGRYYGAITSTHISMALAEVTGREVERRWIEVPEPIREPGEYDITLRFSTEIAATIHVTAETEE